MPVFKKDPEKAAARAQMADEQRRAQAEAAFRATPVGQARTAREAGRKFFQIEIPLEETTLSHWLTTQKVARIEATGLLERIEAEGWRLDDVGYVYQVTGSLTGRKGMLDDRAQEITTGRIVGIYLFRASDLALPARPEATPPPPHATG